MLSQSAAIIAAVLLGCLICFQLLLAAGLPLGQAAWGGQHRVLPAKLRVGSLAAAAILGLAAWVVLARAGVLLPQSTSVVVRVGAWVFGAYLCLNTLGNFSSKSRIERAIMTPATVILAACFFIVAMA